MRGSHRSSVAPCCKFAPRRDPFPASTLSAPPRSLCTVFTITRQGYGSRVAFTTGIWSTRLGGTRGRRSASPETVTGPRETPASCRSVAGVSFANSGFVARTRSGVFGQAMSRHASRTLRRGLLFSGAEEVGLLPLVGGAYAPPVPPSHAFPSREPSVGPKRRHELRFAASSEDFTVSERKARRRVLPSLAPRRRCAVFDEVSWGLATWLRLGWKARATTGPGSRASSRRRRRAC